MAADRVSLSEGYEGALQTNRNLANEGESASALAKKQHSQTAELQGQNKGAFAAQAANGSTATANTYQASALLHTANAEGGSKFVRQTAQHEDAAASAQQGESTSLDTTASDLANKINRA
ncbi:MAG: hypothetical protein PGN07_02145 [Aeromicrobium erythreum]